MPAADGSSKGEPKQGQPENCRDPVVEALRISQDLCSKTKKTLAIARETGEAGATGSLQD